MQEQIRKISLENEVLDTIVGVSIFRTNAEGKEFFWCKDHQDYGIFQEEKYVMEKI